MLFFVLLVPIVFLHRQLVWRDRFLRVAGAAGLAMLLIFPWVIRNLATFDEPTFLAVGPGYVLEVGNCDDTYSGRLLGYWSFECDDGTTWPDGDESVIGAAKMERATEYIGDHLSDQPKVIAARVGRLLGLYRPFQTADFEVFFERRIRSHVTVSVWANWIVMASAVAGGVLLRRRTTIWPELAIIATTVLTAAMAFGIGRYRTGADVAFVVLAAVAWGALVDRWRPPA
jgi:hypothetical protein